MSRRLFGLAITGGGVLVLSPDSLFIRLLDADISTTLFWRGLAMALGLGLYVAVRDGGRLDAYRDMLARPIGWALGVLFAVTNTLFVTTVENTGIADALGCLATASIFAAIFAAVFLRETAPLRTWLAAAVIAGGLLLIALGGTGNLLGRIAGIATAMSFGATFVVMRAIGDGDTLPGLSLGGAMIAMVMVLPATPLAIEAGGLPALAGMMFILPASFVLIGRGPRYLPAPEVSLLMLLETVFGTLWAWLFLAEIPTTTTLLAVVIILATLAIFYAREAMVARRNHKPLSESTTSLP